MAKYFVNGLCVGCGMCAGICPNVFHMEVAAVASEDEVKTADADAAKEAMASCPMSAIEEV